MMGEQFEAEDFVVGMVLKLRPQFDKIDIWMRDASQIEAIAAIKSDVAKIVQIDEAEFEYAVFKEVAAQAK